MNSPEDMAREQRLRRLFCECEDALRAKRQRTEVGECSATQLEIILENENGNEIPPEQVEDALQRIINTARKIMGVTDEQGRQIQPQPRFIVEHLPNGQPGVVLRGFTKGLEGQEIAAVVVRAQIVAMDYETKIRITEIEL